MSTVEICITEDSQIMKSVSLVEIERDVASMEEKEFMGKYGFSKNDLRFLLDTLARRLAAGPPWIPEEVQE